MSKTEIARSDRMMELYEVIRTAKAEIKEIERELMPIGSYHEIPRGRGFVRGFVRRHGSSPDSVCLELTSNGNEFWPGVYFYIQAMGSEPTQ